MRCNKRKESLRRQRMDSCLPVFLPWRSSHSTSPEAHSRAEMRSTARDEEGARVLISALLRLLDLSRCAFPQHGAICNRPEALEKRLSLGFGLSQGASRTHCSLPRRGRFRLGCRFDRLLDRASGQPVFGFLLDGGVCLCPGEKLVEIKVEIGGDCRSGFTDFLDDGIFHDWGWVRSSGVQITGMCR